MLWHPSLKSMHYRTLLIYQNKNTRFEGQNMGGMKDMLSHPCQNMGGIHHPIPPRIYALGHFPSISKNATLIIILASNPCKLMLLYMYVDSL